jgi:hypothetical protein
MTNSVAHYLSQLRLDDWRKTAGFSSDVEIANQKLFDPQISEAESIQILREWLQKYQPCLFGRIAAKLGSISYCVLSENDLQQSDEVIKEKIQKARLEWTRDGFEGRKSGFVILAVSPLIANAIPSPEMRELARRLCYLYLETEIQVDNIHLEQIYLQKPGPLQTTWKWYAGVNYFSAQGDNRWWHDHRIPGGMAFSVNSVGHLVKSGMIANVMEELEKLTGSPNEGYPDTKVDSLDKALDLAMRTINLAANAVSGKATELLPLPFDRSELLLPECPVKLSLVVADKNFCEYRGYYHTDYTLPSEYFRPEIERPKDIKVHSLDFTYLFDKSLDNPDFKLMGEGYRIRDFLTKEETPTLNDRGYLQLKRLKGEGEEVSLSENERLVKALNG